MKISRQLDGKLATTLLNVNFNDVTSELGRPKDAFIESLEFCVVL